MKVLLSVAIICFIILRLFSERNRIGINPFCMQVDKNTGKCKSIGIKKLFGIFRPACVDYFSYGTHCSHRIEPKRPSVRPKGTGIKK